MTTFDAEGNGSFKRSTRMPLDAVVRLHFEGTVAYQNGFAANVSATGMFVKHPDPPATGTRLVFEFVLGSQRRPVQGAGVVVWTRERYEGPGRPAGIGIQFTQVDSASKQNIAEALFEYLEASLGEEMIGQAGEELGFDAGELAQVEQTVRGLERPEGVETGFGESQALFREPQTAGQPAAAASAPPSTPPRFALAESDADASTPAESEEQRVERMVREALEAEASVAGAAVARSARGGSAALWIGVVAACVLLAASGWALWRYGLGPDRPPAGKAAAGATTPTPEPRPPLPADLGPVSTLAETVGASVAEETAPEPILPAAEDPPEAAGSPADEAPAPAEGVATPEPAPAEPLRPLPAATPTAVAPAAVRPAADVAPHATRLDEIEWTEATGTTVVTLSADGPFAPGSFSYSEMGGEKPRILVRLRGLELAYRRTALPVGTAAVAGIRTGWHVKEGVNEQHVVLDLAPGGARLDGFEALGSRIVLKLAPR